MRFRFVGLPASALISDSLFSCATLRPRQRPTSLPVHFILPHSIRRQPWNCKFFGPLLKSGRAFLWPLNRLLKAFFRLIIRLELLFFVPENARLI